MRVIRDVASLFAFHFCSVWRLGDSVEGHEVGFAGPRAFSRSDEVAVSEIGAATMKADGLPRV